MSAKELVPYTPTQEIVSNGHTRQEHNAPEKDYWTVANYSRWLLGMHEEDASRFTLNLQKDPSLVNEGVKAITALKTRMRSVIPYTHEFMDFRIQYMEARIGQNLTPQQMEEQHKELLEKNLGSSDIPTLFAFEVPLFNEIRRLTKEPDSMVKTRFYDNLRAPATAKRREPFVTTDETLVFQRELPLTPAEQ